MSPSCFGAGQIDLNRRTCDRLGKWGGLQDRPNAPDKPGRNNVCLNNRGRDQRIHRRIRRIETSGVIDFRLAQEGRFGDTSPGLSAEQVHTISKAA